MAFCEKCGAILSDDMKFCDKCGAQVYSSAESGGQSGLNNNYHPYAIPQKSLLDMVKSILPESLTTPGDKTMLFAGIGCMAALSFIYIICMFVFMADICLPIGFGSDAFMPLLSSLGTGNSGASSLWLLIYLLLGLSPAVFAVLAFTNKKFRVYAVFTAAAAGVITVLSFLAWLISAPGSVIEAITYYSGPNKYAWYVLTDALSEVWYLKLILAAGTVAGFGVDYLVNKD